jgi:hypothetical protein
MAFSLACIDTLSIQKFVETARHKKQAFAIQIRMFIIFIWRF